MNGYEWTQDELKNLTLMNILTAPASDDDKVSALIMTVDAWDAIAEQERQAAEVEHDAAWLGEAQELGAEYEQDYNDRRDLYEFAAGR